MEAAPHKQLIVELSYLSYFYPILILSANSVYCKTKWLMNSMCTVKQSCELVNLPRKY